MIWHRRRDVPDRSRAYPASQGTLREINALDWRSQGLLVLEDVEDEDNDGQEVSDNDVDSAELRFALNQCCLSWGYDTEGSGDLVLVESLCCF